MPEITCTKANKDKKKKKKKTQNETCFKIKGYNI